MSEERHCFNRQTYCTLHDCDCRCDGCLPHSAPHIVELRALRAELAAANRELERHRHGNTIEGDDVCPDSLHLTEALRLRAADQSAIEWTWGQLIKISEALGMDGKATVPMLVERATGLRSAIRTATIRECAERVRRACGSTGATAEILSLLPDAERGEP
jgi:hypothetical protein